MMPDWKYSRPHDEPYTPVVEYFWGGAASTGFSICPKNDTVVVALTQFMPYKPTLSQAFIHAVDQAAAPILTKVVNF